MKTNTNKIKAIGLVSGGLDSTLATKLLMDQGIEVIPVNFSTGFCVTSVRRKTRRGDEPIHRLKNEALRAGEILGVPVQIVDISSTYMDEVVLHPRYGYGKAFNPCVDCRIYMLRKAKELMERWGAHFVYTGEVLGQRPMSQQLRQLRNIEKQSGLEGLLLRPLSAKLLPPTIPEQKGWVEREKLLDISGRSRKVQLALVEKLSIPEYAQPAGGCCYLVDHNFARRIKDVLNHNHWQNPGRDELAILPVGRYLRLDDEWRITVGRDEGENNFLMNFRNKYISFQVPDFGSPITLGIGVPNDERILWAARVTVSYSDTPDDSPVRVLVRYPNGKEEIMHTNAYPKEELARWRVN